MKSIRLFLPLVAATMLAVPDSRAQSDDSWEFSLTPYLWLATISGTAAAGGSEPPPINPDYNFFALDNLDGFAFLHFSARKGRWSINTDAVYVAFADSFQVGPVNTQIDLDGTILEFGGGYVPPRYPETELLFGARGIRLEAGIMLDPGPDGSDANTWWDPYVGASYRHNFGEHWGIMLRGDVGGFSASSKLTLNAHVGGTYRFNDLFTLIFGYRYLKFDFKEGDFVSDLEALGYTLGFEFSW